MASRIILRSVRTWAIRSYSTLRRTTDLPDKVHFKLTREQWALGTFIFYIYTKTTCYSFPIMNEMRSLT